MQRARPAVLCCLVLAAACGSDGDSTDPTNQAPTAMFDTKCTALTCIFTNVSTDADGSIASTTWDFGDGATSTEASPTHAFASASPFTVTMTVTDDRNATATVTQTVATAESPTVSTVGLTLQQEAGFSMVLVSTGTCEAHGNTFTVTAPVASELTVDACYEVLPKQVDNPGPFPAGTVITANVIAAALPLASPDVRVEGSYPTWTVRLEDGFNQDFEDMVVTVTATPTQPAAARAR